MTTVAFTSSHAQNDAVLTQPPHFPDAAHVLNGCHISSATYVAKFLAAYPQEKARPLVVEIRNVDGRTRPHTLVLVTWRGMWWGRDEYFGVFPLQRPIGDGTVTDQIASRAGRRLDRHSDDLAKNCGWGVGTLPPKQLSATERALEVAAARALLPYPSEQFWVRSGDEDIPFLLFRPAPGQIAVYEPLTGTALAECAQPDGAKVVAAVAARLGYPVSSVRAGGSVLSAR